MAFNPSQKGESLNNPTQRANQLNDPQFENQQGYFPYDLTHPEMLTPRFGEVTPSMHLITAPGDRIVVKDNTKLIRNRIEGNFLSTLNQYVDSFFVSLRSCYPTNYEKMIPNPTKGQDLPNSALPQVSFAGFVSSYFNSSSSIQLTNLDIEYVSAVGALVDGFTLNFDDDEATVFASNFALGRMLFLSTILSRGQLLDYMGIQFDVNGYDATGSRFQKAIDDFQYALWNYLYHNEISILSEVSINPNLDVVVYGQPTAKSYDISTLPLYRSAISDIFEAGHMVEFSLYTGLVYDEYAEAVETSYFDLLDYIRDLFPAVDTDDDNYIRDIDSSSNPFQLHHLNLTPILAVQQIVAQYYTNNTVDNIFNSDLYMQLLRATMYPSSGGFSSEPTFTYNGVTTEYDYLSAGGWYHSLISPRFVGLANRQYLVASLLFLLRRSLRYGDYFATARPNMLAVGQLSINVTDGMVSPIDVTKNLLMQRYLNAANYIGSGFLPYYASIYGVTPSDTGVIPRYISHRKIEIQNQITNNTADKQGEQTTNLVGYSDDTAFDVFIDDFGVLISLTSFDVLPIYTSGIDSTYHLTDRFDYFNPMLQNIGDQPIYVSEMLGNPELHTSIFGYTMRNAEYKFKIGRAHGAFCNNELAGYLMKYPVADFRTVYDTPDNLHINPDYIRDKPYYLDAVLPQSTGVSPAQYWHFVVACLNQVQCARKIQATPPVLF